MQHVNTLSLVYYSTLKLVDTDRPTDRPTDIVLYRATIAAKKCGIFHYGPDPQPPLPLYWKHFIETLPYPLLPPFRGK